LKHEEHIAMPHKTAATVAHTIGIDAGKNTLHLIGLDDKGAIVLREKVARDRITVRLANVPQCLIGIEAGMATHYVARELSALGHDVKQVPPAYAKPFRQGHKNDFRDAYAIAEAVQRPSTRCVPVKTDDQLDLQALHRVRSRLVGQRTAVINQIRSFLLEHGIAIRQGLRFLRQQLPDILAKRSDVLSPRMIRIIEDLSGDWRRLDERIEHITAEIEVLAQGSESCRQLMTVPGVGPIIASAMVAAIGNGTAFAKGRDFAAWLGLIPKQMSTGDRTILGRITKRGNRYLRTLFMQGARVILLRPANWMKHSFGPWLTAAANRLHHNVLATALANKLARIAWTVLMQARSYEARVN
jgi:transposase